MLRAAIAAFAEFEEHLQALSGQDEMDHNGFARAIEQLATHRGEDPITLAKDLAANQFASHRTREHADLCVYNHRPNVELPAFGGAAPAAAEAGGHGRLETQSRQPVRAQRRVRLAG
jgi:hypothetical protein